jgi:hypothetical protein
MLPFKIKMIRSGRATNPVIILLIFNSCSEVDRLTGRTASLWPDSCSGHDKKRLFRNPASLPQ